VNKHVLLHNFIATADADKKWLVKL
jgi:hypothetical protein